MLELLIIENQDENKTIKEAEVVNNRNKKVS